MDVISYVLARRASAAATDASNKADAAQADATLALTKISYFPNGLKYQGAVDYYEDLPETSTVGYIYTVKYKKSGEEVTNLNTEYAWGIYEGVEQWIMFNPEVGTMKKEIQVVKETVDEVVETVDDHSTDISQLQDDVTDLQTTTYECDGGEIV